MKHLLLMTSLLLIGTGVLLAAPSQKEPTPEETMRDFQQEMEQERQMIFKMLGRGFQGQASGDEFEQLIKKFLERSQRNFFKDENFNQFFKEWNPYKSMVNGESHWLETPKERIYILKLDEMKDTPVDIKINRGNVVISAKRETKNKKEKQNQDLIALDESLFSFNESFPVPEDCDGNSATIENRDGEVRIKFPKKAPKPEIKRPLKKQQGDVTI